MKSIRIHQKYYSLLIPLIIVFLVALAGCDDEQQGPTPPDFSTVPDRYDTTAADTAITEDNLKMYIFERGSGPFEVVSRDQIEVHYTGRIQSTGEVFDSSYKNGSTDPEVFLLPSTIDGFRQGVIGMKIGGKRTIVVPPELGYQSENSDLTGKTLVYDLTLVDIL